MHYNDAENINDTEDCLIEKIDELVVRTNRASPVSLNDISL